MVEEKDGTMIGYHYTDAANLKRILKQGLIPYACPKTNTDLWGIMVFKERQEGRNLLGSILWQMSQKNCMQVIELRVRYDRRYSFSSQACVVDRYPMAQKKSVIDMEHTGNIEKWAYHQPGVATDCILTQVHPANIKHLATYELRPVNVK